MFRDAVVIVTGAASGLGRGIAEALGRQGAMVIATDIDAAGALWVAGRIEAEGGRAEAARLDITDRAATDTLVDGVVARYGRIDLVFANAGIAVVGLLADTGGADWRRLVEVNLLGTVATASAGFAALRRQAAAGRGGGRIVVTASLAGLVGYPALPAYAATKAALVSYADHLRREGRAHGIAVTCLCPGFIETPIFAASRYAALDRARAFGPSPLKLLTIDHAVPRLLDGVRRGRPVVTMPALGTLLWRLQRFAPGLVDRIQRGLLGKIEDAGRL